jgi:acylphosphatase
MTAPIETVRLRITGRVQGVGYRFWATRTAASLGLRGWVRNRTDGGVEALVMGAPERPWSRPAERVRSGLASVT